MRWKCNRSALALGAAFLLAAACAAAAENIVVFNQDNTHFILDAKEKRKGREDFIRYFDTVCRGAVTHFFMCPNSMRSNLDTKSIEPIWEALKEDGVRPEWGEAAKWLHDNGVDQYAIWTARAREKGVSPWLTMRMNDIHSASDPKRGMHCRFWREHPEYKVVPNYEGPTWSCHALDYSHEAVRARALSYVRELLERYDVDGLECDWLRFPWHLTRGREREKSHVLTEFMREVRKIADAASARRGRRILVGARVASNRDAALLLGTDAEQWAKDGSIDWLVPCNFFTSADFDLDYADWARRISAANSGVLVVPGIDTGVAKAVGAGGGRQYLTLAEYRGWCASMYAQKAPGVYLFNLFQFDPASHDQYKNDSSIWDAVLDGGLSPAAVSAAPSLAYPVSFCDCLPTGPFGLQTNKSVGEGVEIRIRVGRPPESGEVAVLLAFDAAVSGDEIRGGVRLNGRAPTSIAPEKTESWIAPTKVALTSWRLAFDAFSLKEGANVVSVRGFGNDGTKLRACELQISTRRTDLAKMRGAEPHEH